VGGFGAVEAEHQDELGKYRQVTRSTTTRSPALGVPVSVEA
jgi:hypothetical protein